MRTLTALLVFTLVLTAGCSADDPARSDDAGQQSAVVSRVPGAEFAVTEVGSADRQYPAATPAPRPAVVPTPATPAAPSPTGDASGEPWLAGTAWATVFEEPNGDPRLETVADRVPSDDARPPLAVQVVAERPSRPHDHTHPGSG